MMAPMDTIPAHESFRRKDLIRALTAAIAREAEGLGPVRLMHVCGTHERSVNRFGLRSLLPPNVRIVAGPGCPVCVCPVSDLLAARELALRPGVILASFGDMLSVPMPGGTLLDARKEGAELRVVYSVSDALALARSEPEREIVFFSIGFETTAAPTAAVVASLRRSPVPNFSLVSSSRVVPEALEFLLATKALSPDGGQGPSIDGLILPGHVSVIIGTEAYRPLVDRFGIPCAVAGFEPVDLLESVRDLLAQRRSGKAELHNGYSRAVRPEGNVKAKGLMAEVYEKVDSVWRGLGTFPGTGLALRPAFASYDADVKFSLRRGAEPEEGATGCLCPRVMVGLAEPEDCPRFGSTCRPESPVGPCMVSEEGTCRIRLECGELP
jgi:hydrogenase expression/formation protein HypD